MKIIQFIDRILWATRMASHTTPTYVGDYMPHDDTPSTAGSYDGEIRSARHDRKDLYFADA